MKASIKYLLVAVVLLAVTNIQAQNYRTHKVKEGETVISIAKQYNVTPFDLYKLNPDAKDGIDVNSILIIPESIISDGKMETERVFIGYKSHRVKRKETLYGLATRYNITQEDLKKHNTFLYSENLKRGQKLQIPVYKTVKRIPKTIGDSMKHYTVKPKEGKWRIAYKFGVSIDELETMNPKMGDTLQVGQIINVPNIADNEQKTLDDSYGYYKVLPKEGFYRLKVKLGVTQNDLEALNPGLERSGLKAGMILKVPKQTVVTFDSRVVPQLNLSDSIQNFKPKHLVEMLPFRLQNLDVDSVYETKLKLKNDKLLGISLDFHTGVLVALDSAQKMGLSVKLDVYDTAKSQTETKRLVKTHDFSDVDAVIGPLIQKNFETAAVALADNNIPIVSPITKEVYLYDNVFQSRPSVEFLRENIIGYVQRDTLVKQVFIIHDSQSIAVTKLLKNKFPHAKVIASRKDKDGKDLNYVLMDDFIVDKEEDINVFSEGKNIVFLETKNSGLVSNVSSILNSLNSEEKPIVLATTDKNSAFEDDDISNIYLSNLHFLYPSIRKDYDTSKPDGFVKLYTEKFGYTPSLYAVRGFDVTMDVLLRLSAFDSLYDSAKLDSETQYSENKFLYKKKLFGGYYNTASYIVNYDNLKIVEVN